MTNTPPNNPDDLNGNDAIKRPFEPLPPRPQSFAQPQQPEQPQQPAAQQQPQYYPQQPQQVHQGYQQPQQQYGHPQQPQQPYNGFGGMPPKKPVNKGLIGGLIAGGAFVLILIIVAAFVFISGLSNSDEEGTTRPSASSSASSEPEPSEPATEATYGFEKSIGADEEPRLLFTPGTEWEITSQEPEGSITYTNNTNQCDIFLYQTYISDVAKTAGDDEATTLEMVYTLTGGTISKNIISNESIDSTINLIANGSVETKQLDYPSEDGGYTRVSVRGFADSDTGFLVSLNCTDQATLDSTWEDVVSGTTVSIM